MMFKNCFTTVSANFYTKRSHRYCRGKLKMKTLKIIAVLTLVALAAALSIASAYAYTGGRIGTSGTTNPSSTATNYGSYTGGMMGNGGMMRGYGYSGTGDQTPQQSGTLPTTPSNQYQSGEFGCRGMMSRIP
jgi:uncharacterized membrane protein